jgi:cation transport ATPase
MADIPSKKLTVAVGGMTCINCEILVERRFREIACVTRVNVDRARRRADIDHAGDLDIATLAHAVEADGYVVSPWDERAASIAQKNNMRDFAEIAGIFAVLWDWSSAFSTSICCRAALPYRTRWATASCS